MSQNSPTARCADGNRYEAKVPDTLDLADRMALAINALTNVWDAESRWGLKFIVDFSRKPAVLFVNHLIDVYLNIPPKFVEALALCRLASGEEASLDVDAGVIQAQVDLIGEDGLTYCPTDIFDRVPMGIAHFAEGEEDEMAPFAEIWGEGRQLVTMSILAQVDDNPQWIDIGKRKVDRILALTREKDGFRFLWRAQYQPGQNPPSNADEPGMTPDEGGGLYSKEDLFTTIYSIGSTGHGAGLFYRVTGYGPALELCRGLARWALARVFNSDDGRYTFWHYHHGLYALMAVCEYGYAIEDREVLERVDACYRWAREMGDPLIGFYPEVQQGTDRYLERYGNSVEICEVADMVWLALYLTRAGLGDYWDDIDRWVRNVYAQGQLCDPHLFKHIPDSYYNTEPDNRLYRDSTNIREKSVGSFFGWMRANEALTVNQTPDGRKLMDSSIMHCCTANGARTFFCVWDSMVSRSGNLVKVHLLLNRASEWLDIDSYLPAAGKVVIHIKDAPEVAVRIPEWCPTDAVRVTVGTESRRGLVEGRYLRIGWLKPGERVTLEFPVPERVVHRVLGEIPYKLELRGSDVVSIDPKGVAYPLYENTPSGEQVARTRFIPKLKEIIW